MTADNPAEDKGPPRPGQRSCRGRTKQLLVMAQAHLTDGQRELSHYESKAETQLSSLPGWGPSSLNFLGPHIISHKIFNPARPLSLYTEEMGICLRLQHGELESRALGKLGQPLLWDVSLHVDYDGRS